MAALHTAMTHPPARGAWMRSLGRGEGDPPTLVGPMPPVTSGRLT